MQIYENFISYRRADSLSEVQNIYQALLNKGISTFCDIHSMHSGRFDDELLATVDNCTNYILILKEHSLDRCVDEGDWLRFEISEALKTKKNIICVFIGAFKFPDWLPEDIREIRYYNGIHFDISYFDSFIDNLISRFLVDENRARISNPLTDFVIQDTTLLKYVGDAETVKIPDSITHIAEEAFKDKTHITEIILPDQLEQIDGSAFERCSSLTHITLPDSLRSVGRKAFCRCYSLAFVAFNDALEAIGAEAFSFCDKLKTVRLGNSLRSVDDTAFNSCNKLSSIYVGKNNPFFTSQDGILFSRDMVRLIRCPEGYSEELIDVPDSVEELAPWSFSKCLNLVDVTLPPRLRIVGAYAFNDCANIMVLTLSDRITDFDVTALNGWNSGQRVIAGKHFSPLIKYQIDQKLRECDQSGSGSEEEMPDLIVVKTTFESQEEAQKMAQQLLARHYIASAQLSKLNVFYTWNEEFCNENEIELSCISTGSMFSKIDSFIRAHHSYECCQILCFPVVKSSEEFKQWIQLQVNK